MGCENSVEQYISTLKGPMTKAAKIAGESVSQGSYSAFVAAPLPPDLDWTPRLIGALSDGDRLVGPVISTSRKSMMSPGLAKPRNRMAGSSTRGASR